MSSQNVIPDPADKRRFLFLQGHPSSFPRNLAKAIQRAGYKVFRINLSAGDMLYWYGLDANHYRGRFADWEAYLQAYITRNGVTDILYYGDRRPYHVVAAEVAHRLGINAFTYEFGYLRPDWITLERYGMSGFSHFPKDPEVIRKIGRKFDRPDLTRRYQYSKNTELFHELVYNLSSMFLRPLYPHYRSDRYYNLLLEYVAGIPGIFTENRNERRAQRLIVSLLESERPYFLFPLQLQCDYQLRCNSPFEHQGEAIDQVIRSFAAHASPDHVCVFKQHPLDNGWEGWPGLIRAYAARAGVADRVHFMIGGDLDLLLDNALGCVSINSTVGLYAMQAGCPVKILGTALYDIEELCHQGELDSFWQAPLKPDEELLQALLRALAGTIQVKGNFFTEEGQAAAIPRMLEMILGDQVNGAGAFVDPPPRLAKQAVS